MGGNTMEKRYNYLMSVLIYGVSWGIFEATVGYALHFISFPYSFLVWYPAACFFISNVYRKTQKLSSIFAVGTLCAAIKLLNLFLPGRIDKVINPAISIVFESLAILAVIALAERLWGEKEKGVTQKAVIAFSMNTLWRVFYIVYLAFFVPAWMREISVIVSAEKFLKFFVTQNICTSMIVFIGYQYSYIILKPFFTAQKRLAVLSSNIPAKRLVPLQIVFTVILLSINISLQILLK